MAQSASSFAQQTANASKSFLQFCTEQPLVLAGLGLAIGAAIGASMPATEAENRVMGEASDDMKERAQRFAEEQYAKGKTAAQDAIQSVKEEIGTGAPWNEAAHGEAMAAAPVVEQGHGSTK
jgi:hypothetical protein